MVKKLLFVGIGACFLSVCLSCNTASQGAPWSSAPMGTSTEAPGISTTIPAAPAGQWSGWIQVPGGATTDAALAAAAFNNKLYVLSRGINDGLVYFNKYDGSDWSGWAEVPGGFTTDVPLAAAAFNDKLYVLSKSLEGTRSFL